MPFGFTAQELPDPKIGKGGFLELFGQPDGQTSCECERRTDVSLMQALNLLNGSTIADAIASENGRVSKLILGGASGRQIVEQLYRAALNRPPEPKELDLGQTYLAGGMNRTERA